MHVPGCWAVFMELSPAPWQTTGTGTAELRLATWDVPRARLMLLNDLSRERGTMAVKVLGTVASRSFLWDAGMASKLHQRGVIPCVSVLAGRRVGEPCRDMPVACPVFVKAPGSLRRGAWHSIQTNGFPQKGSGESGEQRSSARRAGGCPFMANAVGYAQDLGTLRASVVHAERVPGSQLRFPGNIISRCILLRGWFCYTKGLCAC